MEMGIVSFSGMVQQDCIEFNPSTGFLRMTLGNCNESGRTVDVKIHRQLDVIHGYTILDVDIYVNQIFWQRKFWERNAWETI